MTTVIETSFPPRLMSSSLTRDVSVREYILQLLWKHSFKEVKLEDLLPVHYRSFREEDPTMTEDAMWSAIADHGRPLLGDDVADLSKEENRRLLLWAYSFQPCSTNQIARDPRFDLSTQFAHNRIARDAYQRLYEAYEISIGIDGAKEYKEKEKSA